MILFRKRDLIYIIGFIAVFIVFYFADYVVNDYSPTLDEIDKLTLRFEQGDNEAFIQLQKYYFNSEQNISKKIDFFRKYQDKRHYFKIDLSKALFERGSKADIQEGLDILKTLANQNNYDAQRDLAYFYTNDKFVEKDLEKAAYWIKISECNKKGINIAECEIDKEFKE